MRLAAKRDRTLRLVRLLRSYTAQLLALVIGMLDRILVPAVLIRTWGPDGAASWIVASSSAGLFAILDLGVQAYATAWLHALVGRGDRAGLERAVRVVAWTYC